jgi:uncharacterized membrane protein
MRSKVVVAGHALHPMLIAFPLGLLGISPLWDILRLATGDPMWGAVAFWTITAGVVSALVAAVPGFIDYVAIPNRTRAKQVGTWHMVLNLTLVVFFLLSLALRASARGGYAYAGVGAMLPGWIGVAIGVVAAWFGGELVERLGMGVHEDAHLNAASSLRPPRRRPAPTKPAPASPGTAPAGSPSRA